MLVAASAATYTLADGRKVTGEIIESGSDDATALVNAGGDNYERIQWGEFSQEDLRAFAEKYKDNKKIYEAVELYIEITPEERAAMSNVKIDPLPEIVVEMQNERKEPAGSVIVSFFKSPLGWVLALLVYGANIYAGLEIALFRARPKPMLAGLAAIPFLGFVSNVVFVFMPTRIAKPAVEQYDVEEELPYDPALTPTGATQEQAGATPAASAAHAEVEQPKAKADVYSRGKFTFNKRFFETKLAGFIGATRSHAVSEKILTIKSPSGEYVVQHITRLTPSDVYFEAEGASGEIGLHFSEINEVMLKHHA